MRTFCSLSLKRLRLEWNAPRSRRFQLQILTWLRCRLHYIVCRMKTLRIRWHSLPVADRNVLHIAGHPGSALGLVEFGVTGFSCWLQFEMFVTSTKCMMRNSYLPVLKYRSLCKLTLFCVKLLSFLWIVSQKVAGSYINFSENPHTFSNSVNATLTIFYFVYDIKWKAH